MTPHEKIRVLGVVPTVADSSPGQRFRIEQWQPYMERHGIELVLAPFESEELRAVLYVQGHMGQKASLVGRSLLARLNDLRSARGRFHCAYVFREASLVGPALERLVHRTGLPYVFDFDDAVFVRYRSPTNGYLSLLKNPARTKVSCRLADHVMAGNRYLADYASRFNPRVSIVPTTIDLSKYRIDRSETAGRSSNGPLVIGWSGSHSTAQHLAPLSRALRRLARERDFTLLVIGAPAPDMPGVDTRAIVWSSQSEVADLRQIDIGVMPLPDEPWSRGKCGLKLLQFMALGIPSVSSPVGVNTEIVDDGTNGFLAANEDEWVGRLRDLVDSAQLRRRVGTAGRRTVEKQFDGERHADRVASIFQQVSAGRAVRSSS